MTLVELIGPPGAGKSATADALVKVTSLNLINLGERRDLQGRKLSVITRRFQWVAACATRPGLARATGEVRTGTPDVDRQLLEVVRRDMLLRRLPAVDRPYLIDDGSWHAAMWSSALAGRTQLPSSISSRLYRPDLLVHVTTDCAESWRRVLRDGGRESFVRRTRDEVLDALGRYNRMVDDLGVRVTVVSSSADAVGVILDWLRRD